MEDCEAVYTNRIIRDWWVSKTEDERRLMVRSYFVGGNSEKVHTLYGIMPEEMEEIYIKSSTFDDVVDIWHNEQYNRIIAQDDSDKIYQTNQPFF